MTPVFVLADGPFPMMASYEYRGYLGLGGFIRCLGMSALYLVLLFLARPLFKWFSSYEFVHKNIWQTIAVVGIVAVSLPRMTTNTLATQPVLSAIWLGVLLFIPFVVYFVSRVRVERKRKALLESEVALTEEYARFILEQIEYLERSAVQLDEVASDIAHVQEEIESAFLKKQVAELKDLCNQLRHGSFSDNPALDVVLATYEEEFAKEGLQIDYRVRPLGDAATQAALVAQAMLAWTLGSCKAAMGRDGASRESGRDGVTVGEDGADVEFRIIREGDQLVFMLDAPSNRRRRFSRHILEERVPSFDGMFTEADDGARKTVRALVSMA